MISKFNFDKVSLLKKSNDINDKFIETCKKIFLILVFTDMLHERERSLGGLSVLSFNMGILSSKDDIHSIMSTFKDSGDWNIYTQQFLDEYSSSSSFFHWDSRIYINPMYVHTIRKQLVHDFPDFYKKLLSITLSVAERSDEALFHSMNCYLNDFSELTTRRLYVAISFMIQIYLNVPTEFDEDILFDAIWHFKHKFIFNLPDILSDSEIMGNICSTNQLILNKIVSKMFWYGFPMGKEDFSWVTKYYETFHNSSNYSELEKWMIDGTCPKYDSSANLEQQEICIYEDFFTGNFTNCITKLTKYKKELAKFNKIEKELFIVKYDEPYWNDFDYTGKIRKYTGGKIFPETLTFMLNYCRIMTKTDNAAMVSETEKICDKYRNYKIKAFQTQAAYALLFLFEKITSQKTKYDSSCEVNLDKYIHIFLSLSSSFVLLLIILTHAYHKDHKSLKKLNITHLKNYIKGISLLYPNFGKMIRPTFNYIFDIKSESNDSDNKYFNFAAPIETAEVWRSQLDMLNELLKPSITKENKIETKTNKKNNKKMVWVFEYRTILTYPKAYIIDDDINNPDCQLKEFTLPSFFNSRVTKQTCITTQDLAIASSLNKPAEYIHEVITSCLPQMKEHPYIYVLDESIDKSKKEEKSNSKSSNDSQDLPYKKVTVVQKTPELSVKQEKDSINVSLQIGKEPRFTESLMRYEYSKEEHQIFYTIPDKVHYKIHSLLENNTKFPLSSLDEILAIGKSSFLSLKLDIDSKKVESSCEPILYIENNNKYFAVKVRIKPMDHEKCPLKIPGFGEENVVFQEDNKQSATPIVITRNLKEEEILANKLVSELTTLENFYNDGAYSYTTDTPEDILKLMEFIKNHKNKCKVEWSEGKKYNVTQSISNSNFAIKADLNDDNYLSISGGIELSDQRYLTLRTLLDSVNKSVGNYIPVDDDNYIAITNDLKHRLEKMKALTVNGKKDELLSHPLAGNALENLMEDVHCDFSPKVSDIIARRNEALQEKVTLPKNLNAELRSYQKEGFEWLYRLYKWRVGACLADDMGLGKTVQTIALILKVAANGPILITAPTSVCPNWERELNKFAPSLKIKRFSDANSRADLVSSMKKQEVLIVSYGLLPNEEKLLASVDWELAIYDEAQALKNALTQRAKTATKIHAKMRIALTGTPIENNLDDLWSIFNIINPGLLGTIKEFHSRFANATVNKVANKVLKLLISPFILRRLKGDVLTDLPPRTEQVITVEPTQYEQELYETMRKSTIEELENNKLPINQNGQRRLQILAALTKLRQFCCDPAIAGDELKAGTSSKTSAFGELLDEALSGGHRLLVFSQFTSYLGIIKNFLEKKGITYQYIDGTVTEKKRAKAIDEFQSGNGDVFLISLKAGGQGLNLTSADYVVHLDPWWNPAVEDQATDRAYRIGQTRPVNVIRLVIKDSLEEKILELHAKKREVAADFLEGTANVASEAMKLTEEELLALLH